MVHGRRRVITTVDEFLDPSSAAQMAPMVLRPGAIRAEIVQVDFGGVAAEVLDYSFPVVTRGQTVAGRVGVIVPTPPHDVRARQWSDPPARRDPRLRRVVGDRCLQRRTDMLRHLVDQTTSAATRCPTRSTSSSKSRRAARFAQFRWRTGNGCAAFSCRRSKRCATRTRSRPRSATSLSRSSPGRSRTIMSNRRTGLRRASTVCRLRDDARITRRSVRTRTSASRISAKRQVSPSAASPRVLRVLRDVADGVLAHRRAQ